MRNISLLFMLVLLSGCGATSSVKLAALPPAATAFEFQDERPADQRTSRVDSGISGDNTYFGDDNLKPSPPALLRTWLHQQIGPELAGKHISLSEFVVNVYDPSVSVDPNRLGTAAASVPGGYAAAPFAGLLVHGIEKIRSEKIVRVKIQGKLESEEFSTVASERFQGRVTEENVQVTLVKALDQAVSEIRRLLSVK